MKITGIRLRKPFEKQFSYCKLSSVKGVFGLNVCTDMADGYESSALIITEGEINLLNIQTLAIKNYEQQGVDLDSVSFVNGIAVGSASDPDFRTIKKINQHPIFAYDNDDSGFAVVGKARETMHISAFTVPAPYNDLDEYILSFGNDSEEAWESITQLIEKRKFYYRYFEMLADEVKAQRRVKNTKEFEINMRVTRIIIDDMLERGNFYNDGLFTYYFSKEEKKLYKINSEQDIKLFLSNYELNASETIFKYVINELINEAFKNGLKTEIYRTKYYDYKKFRLYINNFKNQIIKISKQKIELVDNGCDGILFISDSNAEPFDFIESELREGLFDKFITNKINFDENDELTIYERRILFDYWFYTTFFDSIMPTKAIIAFIGEKGSGKSIAMRKVGKLLNGDGFDVTPLTTDVRDFDAAVANSDFIAIDNADTKISWLDDRLATVSTGGTIKMRILYTTNSLVDVPTRCFLAITSRTPRFTRDDVADRLLIMKVKRLDEYIPENVLLNEVLENRDMIMSEVIYKLQAIIGTFEENKNEIYKGKLRIADFASIAIKIAKLENCEPLVNGMFKILSNEQARFALDYEPIVDLLADFINSKPNTWVSHTELCKELQDISRSINFKFVYENNPRGFARKMSTIMTNLQVVFEIDSRKCGQNITRYVYKKKPEANIDNDFFDSGLM